MNCISVNGSDYLKCHVFSFLVTQVFIKLGSIVFSAVSFMRGFAVLPKSHCTKSFPEWNMVLLLRLQTIPPELTYKKR